MGRLFAGLHYHLQSACFLPQFGELFTPYLIFIGDGLIDDFDHNFNPFEQMEGMTDIVIPGWAAAVFSPLIVGLIYWLIWLTMATFNNKQNIAVNTANDKEVYTKIEELKADFKEWFVRLETKLDLFIAQENQFMKSENDYMRRAFEQNRK